MGAPASPSGSRPSDQAATRPDASRFDPSRGSIVLEIARASDEHELWALRFEKLKRVYPIERIFHDDGGKWGLRDFLDYAGLACGWSE